MDISIRDILTLDDNNEYLVTGKVSHENATYFYLVDINDNQFFKILKFNENNGKLTEFNDENTVRALIPLFAECVAAELNSIVDQG